MHFFIIPFFFTIEQMKWKQWTHRYNSNSPLHILNHQKQPCSLPDPGHLHRYLHSHEEHPSHTYKTQSALKCTHISFVLTLASHGDCYVNIYSQFTASEEQMQFVNIPSVDTWLITTTNTAPSLTCWSPCPPHTRTSSTCFCTRRTPGRRGPPWEWTLSETLGGTNTTHRHIKVHPLRVKVNVWLCTAKYPWLRYLSPRWLWTPRSSRGLWGKHPTPSPESEPSSGSVSSLWEQQGRSFRWLPHKVDVL